MNQHSVSYISPEGLITLQIYGQRNKETNGKRDKGKKKTFGFGPPPPPFSAQNSKIVGAKKVSQNFWIASDPPPPLLEEVHN